MSKGKQKFSEKTLTDVESFIEALGKSYSSGSVSLHLDLLSTLALKVETATMRLILEWEAESKEYFEKTHILPFTHSAYRGDALITQELADRLGLAQKCTLKPNERNNSNPSHLALFRIITEFNIVRCSRPMGEHKSRFIPELGGRESEVLKKVNALSDLSVDTKDEWLSAIVECLMLYPTMKDSQLNEREFKGHPNFFEIVKQLHRIFQFQADGLGIGVTLSPREPSTSRIARNPGDSGPRDTACPRNP